ncbi:MAG: LTA synthase family protein [Prevotellaceae bacterium]|jgi:phosphoglycerol transferase MdoB-like AlkP superfamily enzyme|nr:LTA synthase family protein [Prevotellaceae bacterium]
MKERIIGLVKVYGFFVLLFVLQKPVFLFCYRSLYADCAWTDWFRVMRHGLPLDFSLAGYLSAIPALLLLLSAWSLARGVRCVWNGYFLLVSLLLAILFVVNLGLYHFWGFPLDSTPLFYFFSSPVDALASITLWQIAGGVVAIAGYAFIAYKLLGWLLNPMWKRLKIPYRRGSVSGVMLLAAGLLFIPIRGGFTAATMNTGTAYFSTNLRLNHAAVNPAFSLMESLFKQKNFAQQYRFLTKEEADGQMQQLLDPEVKADSSEENRLPPLQDTLFTTARPNVLFIILEGFSSHLMTTLGGTPNVAVQLDSLTAEGILFTHFYANSFRTDRGLVSILSGYPAQPTTSLMKYPHKTQSLPSIAGTLRRAGYRTGYYYGGDANFTNMRSYLMASGFESIVCDADFPISERLSKWGAHDEFVFRRLLNDLHEEAQSGDTLTPPFFRVLQTSSSHEPFEVPYRRLSSNRLNAFAYTDSVVGDFIRRFRRLPQWKQTVVVLVPDHLGSYPEHISNFTDERYRIPLLLIGGAVASGRHAQQLEPYGSQQDIAATLLAQLRLSHAAFTFSKDMLNPDAPHFAFFTVPDAFGMITADNRLIYDCTSGTVVLDEGTHKGANLLPGQAYLQKLYDDIASR